MALFGSRCWRCGMRRIGARQFCPACGADALRPDRGIVRDARRERTVAPAGAGLGTRSSNEKAPSLDGPRLRGTVWHARPMAGAVSPAGVAQRSAGTAGGDAMGLLATLDGPSRRKLLRLGAELFLLTAVVAVVYGGPVIWGSGRTPSATPAPTARVPTLAIGANELTMVFARERFGGFDFSEDTEVDGLPMLSGQSGDGDTTLDLWGQPADLQRVTMTCRLSQPGTLDGAQRRHISELVALFAPNALEPLLEELQAALDGRREASRTFESGRVAARLQVIAGANSVAVILLPARLVDDPEPGASSPPASSPRPSGQSVG